MSYTSTSISKRGARQIAQIIRNELIDNPEYRFNHITDSDVDWHGNGSVFECNLLFPTKYGYDWGDPRAKNNGGPGHPDENKSFFFWRDYNRWEEQDDPNYRDPDWLISHHRLYVFDGSVNYWEGSVPKFGDRLPDWQDSDFFGERLVPIAVLGPHDETPTDRDRRYTYYRQTACIWELLDCHCSETGTPCNKVETEFYRNGGSCSCGFGSELYCHSDDDSDDYSDDYSDDHSYDYSTKNRVWSLGTNVNNTLGARMARL